MKRLRDILRLDEGIINDTPRNRRFTEFKDDSRHVLDPTFDHHDYELRYQSSNGHFEANLVHKETGMTHLMISGPIKKFPSGVRRLSNISLFGAKTPEGTDINTGLADKVFEHMNKLNITTVHDNQSHGAIGVENKIIRQNPDLIYHSFDPVTGIATPGRKRVSPSSAKKLGKGLTNYLKRQEIVRELPSELHHPPEVLANFWKKIGTLARAKAKK